jgi:hypothetical protein
MVATALLRPVALASVSPLGIGQKMLQAFGRVATVSDRTLAGKGSVSSPVAHSLRHSVGPSANISGDALNLAKEIIPSIIISLAK